MGYDFVSKRQAFDNAAYVGLSSSHLVSDLQPRRSRTRYIVIGVVVICLILALAIGLGVGLQKSSSGESSESSAVVGGDVNTTSSSTESPTTPTSTQTPTATQAPMSTQAPTTTQTPTSTEPRPPEWISEPCIDQRVNKTCPWSSRPVIMVSLDGFKAEYVLRNFTPVIQRLRECGVHTPYMRAVYPTLTFPNHYTIVTGLYPESHGIVGNSMYDPVINASFSLSGTEKNNPSWWGGEPIWITAKKQGKRTASYFWVGSDVNLTQGGHPDLWYAYDGSVTYEHRVQTVLDWLMLPEGERPDFTTLYFDEPDHKGHGFGPDSPEVNAMLGDIDKTVALLMNGLRARQIDHCVNLIVLADHGMASTSCARQVALNPYMDIKNVLIYDGTTGHVNTKFSRDSRRVVHRTVNGTTPEEVMSSLECKNIHLNVYSRDTVPKRHHYTNSRRIGEVVMDIQSDWLVYAKKRKGCLAGNHGFDNIYKSMHALFLAHGPDFKEGYEAKPFENIELYNLVAELLHIEPAPNNGTFGSLHHLLKTSTPLPDFSDQFNYGQCETTTVKRNTTSDCLCDNMTGFTPPPTLDSTHTPLGQPVLMSAHDACVLPGRQMTSAFSNKTRMPLWTSFTLDAIQLSDPTAVLTNGTCVVPDPRLSEQQNPSCQKYQNTDRNITLHHLYPTTGLTLNDANIPETHLSSLAVPMYTGFANGIWKFTEDLLKQYVGVYTQVNVIVGPVFDYNGDGLEEGVLNETRFVDDTETVAVPSHFYLSLIKCRTAGVDIVNCPTEKLDLLSFVLPHQQYTHNCMSHKEFLHTHVVRIKDIEELVGVRFLTRFSRSNGAQLRTNLQTELWSSDMVTPWENRPCNKPGRKVCPAGPSPLLLISLDGFRADYMSRKLSPTLQKLTDCGVHTPYMRAVYPTVTFPNHYTIVTGLYPESHGIVSNTMYDEDIDQVFKISRSRDPRWWQGEPLWTTVQKQGKKAFTYYWPGSDVNISGIYPDVYKPYGNAGHTQRVFEVLNWISLPAEQRPDFITLYFDEPDHSAHTAGPDSIDVDAQIETVDALMNRLLSVLYERQLEHCVDIIILADHGFADQSCSKTVELKPFYDNITQMFVIERVSGMVFPQFEKINSRTVDRLNTSFPVEPIVEQLMCKSEAMKVFTKATLPKRHHYTHNKRIADILLDMKESWLVFDDKAGYCTGGNHGWDNIIKHMHALFLAYGPSFKKNFTADPFENIELYNLMAEILNISPAPNNGTQGSLDYLLEKPTVPSTTQPSTNQHTCSSQVAQPFSPGCNCSQSNTRPPASSTTVVDTPEASSAVLFGLPQADKEDDMCFLYNSGSATAFSKTFQVPVWNTQIIRNNSMKPTLYVACTYTDTRTNSTDECPSLKENIMMVTLNPTDASEQLSSQTVPMYEGFLNGVWSYLWELVIDYTHLYGEIAVTTGAIFDYDTDGLWEGLTNKTEYADEDNTMALPSHIYVTLVKCRDPTATLPCGGNIDTLSFILPNLQVAPNCLKFSEYLNDNVGRIRDIELLSGLRLMTSFNTTYSARLRTYLAENLWFTNLIQKWEELPCPDKDMCTSDYKPLLLISLDGFRADYLLRNVTPIIGRLSSCGVRAPYMRSVYPTKTFPNHYTIATGLYPESHGIIGNNMYDLDIENRFGLGKPNASDPRWWGGEPIWLTAKKQGLRTATYFWPGSDVAIQGEYPDIWKKYDGSVTYSGRVSEVLSWMQLPKGERPDFITLYFDEPDLQGHKSGPSNEKEIKAALERVDDSVGQLMNGLVDMKLHHCVNVIIIADHGMADVSCKQIVRLRDYVDYDYLSTNTWVWEGPFGRISTQYYNLGGGTIGTNPNPVSGEMLVNNLTCSNPHLHVYTKSDLPIRHHYTNNPRIDDILLDMDDGWLVTRSYVRSCSGGNHGYDNIYKSMQALFLAYGPAFNWNLEVEPFENIELYNLFTEILNITAAPNNGTMGALNRFLKDPPVVHHTSTTTEYTSTLSYTEDEFTQFVMSSSCHQICSTQQTLNKLRALHNSLRTSPSDTSQHVPWGAPPAGAQYGADPLYLLYQSNAAIAYSTTTDMPVWVSQTLTDNQIVSLTLDNVECVVPDIRVIDNSGQTDHICDNNSTSIRWSSLASVSGLKNKVDNELLPLLSSSLVVFREGFSTGVLKNISNVLQEWVQRYKRVNLVAGPVYDYNHDGLADTAVDILKEANQSVIVPTHYFFTVTRCLNDVSDLAACTDLDTASYIIPHTDTPTSCKNFTEYMKDNEARARDVELVTGLQFFTDLPAVRAAQLRTRLPQGLWHQ